MADQVHFEHSSLAYAVNTTPGIGAAVILRTDPKTGGTISINANDSGKVSLSISEKKNGLTEESWCVITDLNYVKKLRDIVGLLLNNGVTRDTKTSANSFTPAVAAQKLDEAIGNTQSLVSSIPKDRKSCSQQR